MKRMILSLGLTLAGVSGMANAAAWHCTLDGARQDIVLTQDSAPESSENDSVRGTVTDPFGRTHEADVSIYGFDRRWHYSDRDGRFLIRMGPSGEAGFYDVTGADAGSAGEPGHLLFCEETGAAPKPLAGDSSPILVADAYLHAIRQKIEHNWIKPIGKIDMPMCKVHLVQATNGTILDVDFGPCDGSDKIYRASIENAVYRSSPLPLPENPALFQRELNFYFEPVPE